MERAADGHPSATMVIREGEGAGSEHPLDGEVVLGRERGSADLVLDDPGVSRRHAAVRAEGGRITVTDLGSSNGTFANGHPVSGEVELADGDEIQLGGTVITVHSADAATALMGAPGGGGAPATAEHPGPAHPGPAPSAPGPALGRRQPSGVNGRLDDSGNIPALTSVFLGPLSIFLLVFSTGAAFFVSLPCAIGAIVLGNMGIRRVQRGEADSHKTLARIGRITGIIGTILSLLAIAVWVIVAVALDAAEDNLSDLIDRVREEIDGATIE